MGSSTRWLGRLATARTRPKSRCCAIRGIRARAARTGGGGRAIRPRGGSPARIGEGAQVDHEHVAEHERSRGSVARWLRGAGVRQAVQEGPEERSRIDRSMWLSHSALFPVGGGADRAYHFLRRPAQTV